MARTKTPANVVGPQIKKLRNKLRLTQEQLATRCQLAGLDISRGTLSHIEARLRCITDKELFLLASIFKISTDDLYPAEMKRRK
jgi:transcriptional regulator with XRE-family HTH domain